MNKYYLEDADKQTLHDDIQHVYHADKAKYMYGISHDGQTGYKYVQSCWLAAYERCYLLRRKG